MASRTCMVVGKLVETAACGLKSALAGSGLLPESYARDEFRAACAAYLAANGPLHGTAQYKHRPGLRGTTRRYQGDAYGTYAWAVYVAEVTVDLDHLRDRGSTTSSPCRKSAR